MDDIDHLQASEDAREERLSRRQLTPHDFDPTSQPTHCAYCKQPIPTERRDFFISFSHTTNHCGTLACEERSTRVTTLPTEGFVHDDPEDDSAESALTQLRDPDQCDDEN